MKRTRPYLDDITVTVGASFDIRFEADGDRGGYRVTCRQLPEVAAHGATFVAARAAARRAITAALQDRADTGKPISRRYVPPATWRR